MEELFPSDPWHHTAFLAYLIANAASKKHIPFSKFYPQLPKDPQSCEEITEQLKAWATQVNALHQAEQNKKQRKKK